MKLLKIRHWRQFPHVLWDGYADAGKMVDGKMPADLRICINNGELEILNADGPNGGQKPQRASPRLNMRVITRKLPAVDLASAG